MNRLSNDRRAQIVHCLVEGMSVRATSRITGAEKRTILNLLEDVGEACAEYQDRVFRNLPCKRLQCDEIWSFVYAKDRNVPQELRGKAGIGSVWTWTAIDADTKLVPCWFIGGRDAGAAYEFMTDLADRLASRVQLTTDGHAAYLSAVPSAFGNDIDYAQLVKKYGQDPNEDERRYSPAVVLGVEAHRVSGFPDRKHISTSYVERQNLTMRMGMRRFTRLTNGFSKKLENHMAHVALHFMHYNFCRVHQTLRVTPAMQAGVADHIWTLDEVVALLPEAERVVVLR
jgi:IS1 family transposase